MHLSARLRRWLLAAVVPLLLILRLALRILRLAVRDELPSLAEVADFLQAQWPLILVGLAVTAAVAYGVHRLRHAGELPGDGEARRGERALARREYAQAAEALAKAVQMGVSRHDPAKLLTMLANAHLELEYYGDAVAAFRCALELNPRLPEAWSGQASVYLRLGDLDEAERCQRRALSLVPDHAIAHNGLGVIYVARNEPHRAVEALERAVVVNPRVGTFHANLAMAYAMTGRRAEAEAALKRARAFGYENWRYIQQQIEAGPGNHDAIST